MATVVFWAAVLVTYWVSTGLAMDPKPGPSNQVQVQLDMAPNSVDDMYYGCDGEMAKKVKDFYVENDNNKDSKLKAAWALAETMYAKKWKKLTPRVGRDQVIAIYVYSSVKGNIYRDFNEAVRTQGPQYKNKFGYHALHYLLTNAIKSMNERRLEQLDDGEDECLTVYRRKNKYFKGSVNTQIRFGVFASASLGSYAKAEVFGDKTCFEIITCMGADISIHSKFENEAEVLIPPYEVFKITEIQTRAKVPNLPCEIVYKVKSTKTPVSNLNCALISK